MIAVFFVSSSNIDFSISFFFNPEEINSVIYDNSSKISSIWSSRLYLKIFTPFITELNNNEIKFLNIFLDSSILSIISYNKSNLISVIF